MFRYPRLVIVSIVRWMVSVVLAIGFSLPTWAQDSVSTQDGKAVDEQITPDQLRFFETAIRPLLIDHCYECHSDSERANGLGVDSRDALLRGGEMGPAVVPFEPQQSLLLRAVRYQDDQLQMPPESPLSSAQILALEQWIKMGVPFPELDSARRDEETSSASFSQSSMKRQSSRNHWSLQPPKWPTVPSVRQSDWPSNTIDYFVLAALELRKLAPAKKADRSTLIRRMTFDLTGLPPTPEEIHTFLADERDDAVARLVDRLLESPAYGEQWGRHWLDVARYADSNGLDENIAHGNAWRYRDYVVNSLNQDKPFDQFVFEQIAGDLMPAEASTPLIDRWIATGFLSLGPKVLAEVDETKMQMDIVDEQIDTVGRVFMGMTFGCARCHDHKFDPITTEDYYGLAGIFKSTHTMDSFTKIARWHEHVLPGQQTEELRAHHAAELAKRKQALTERISMADARVRATAVNTTTATSTSEAISSESQYDADERAEIQQLREQIATWEKAVPEFPSAMGVKEGKIADVPLHIRGNPLRLGDIVPRRTPEVIQGVAPPKFTPDSSGRWELAQWLIDPNHPLTSRVIVNRVWRWHFGRGIVASVDNFGLLGTPPSHPELLDWLARSFQQSGWSIKALHRQILNSSTYQQSIESSPEHEQRDPENSLFGHAPLRRLSAEEFRDAILAVSGQLDRRPTTSLLHCKNREFLFDHTSIDKTSYVSPHRSLYLPVIRNNVYDLFQLLDFPDPAVPNGDRGTTVVAPQALLVLNSDLIAQGADSLAEELAVKFADDLSAIRWNELYLRVFGRAPYPSELEGHAEFLNNVVARVGSRLEGEERTTAFLEGLRLLCHALLASNEFIYIQ